jgi:hypothetical protein
MHINTYIHTYRGLTHTYRHIERNIPSNQWTEKIVSISIYLGDRVSLEGLG